MVYLPAGDQGELDDKIETATDMDDAVYKALLEQIYENVLKMNQPDVTIPVIGWFFATSLKPQISLKYEGFTHLSIAGTHSAGKSMFLRLMGFKVGDSGKLFSCTETDFVMLKLLSSTTTVPIIFDEYKPL